MIMPDRRTRSAQIYFGLLAGVAAVLVLRVAAVQLGGQYYEDGQNSFVRGAVATDVRLAPVVLANGEVVAESYRQPGTKDWVRRYGNPTLTPLLGVAPHGGYPTDLELSVASSNSTDPVELLIDPALQAAASQAVGEAPAALLAVRLDGSVLAAVDRSTEPVADPNEIASGEVALASRSFRLWPKNGASVLFDRPVSPGSTLKPLLVARAVDADLLPEDEVFPAASGFAPAGGRWIRNYGGSTCPAGDVVDGLARSCNSTALAVASRMGPSGVRTSLNAFGFGADHSTSRDVARSMRATTEGWPSSVDEMSLAIIGQGDAQVTMLDLALAYAALATGDGVPQPRFTQADPTGADGTAPVTSAGRAVALAGMAASADHGTAHALSSSDVLAKTGTATRAGTNDSDGWVVALYPADDPQVVVVARVDGAAASAGGGDAVDVAAPFLGALPNSEALEG